jgi:PKD repeat protein
METATASTTFVYTGNGERSATPRAPTYWNVKNLIELKNAQRVTIEGNIVEYAWKAAQTGFAFLLTPKNQENTAPWTVVQDVTIRYNTVRHVNGGVNILGRDYQSSTGSQQAKRITIAHNVFVDVGGTWGGGAQWILMSRSPATITIDHNTVFHTGHVVFVDNGAVSGFVFRNNMARHNEYGIAGSGASFGLTAIAAYFPSSTITKNVLAGGDAARYPSGNYFPSVSTWLAQFVNQAGGDYRLVSTSPYNNAGTDGRDLGADLGALAAAQQGSGVSDSPSTNQSPVAKPGGPYTVAAGAALTVSGSESNDPDGTISSYRWAWGDGSPVGSGVTASHTYASTGTYTLTLTVTDNSGASATATTTVTVQAAAGDIVLTAADVKTINGAWAKVSSSGSPGSQAMASTERGWWTGAPLARPGDYFEMPFVPAPNTAYRVWLRLSARSKSDDSVFVQFTGAVDGSGTPLWRAGTTKALLVNLEDCEGCGVSGWGWQGGAWWIGGASIVRFPSAAPQTIRVQTREDGVKIDQIVLSPVRYMTNAPGAPANDGTILPRTAATLTAKNVVLRAADATAFAGNWRNEADSSGADGRRLGTAEAGWWNATPLASPPNYTELTFTAIAGVPYRAWFRMSANGNRASNDSVFVQYSGVLVGGQSVWRIGTTSGLIVNLENCDNCGVAGWGWQHAAWWQGQTGTITFAATGVQTLRVQTREDGVRIDQIVLSPSQYLTTAPGATKNDTTIVPR